MPRKTGLSGCKAAMKYFFGSKLAWGHMEEFAVAATSIGEGGWSIVFHIQIYRVSQEECARLREGVPYVKIYQYNPKHLCPTLNGYRDNGQRILKLLQLLHTY